MSVFQHKPLKDFCEVPKGRKLYIYTDAACTTAATITDTSGTAITQPINMGGSNTQGTYGGQAIFQGDYNVLYAKTNYPGDSVITLYPIAATAGVGAKNGTTVVATESVGVLHKTILTCTATTITISDDAGVAQYGGVKIYDFPAGLLLTFGAVIDGSLTAGVTGTIINTWQGDVALGTATATTGATLIGTEADIMPSVAIPAATNKVAVCDAVSAATALTESGARWFDGTATAKDCYLNFVIDDDATHTAGTATFTGTVTLHWINLGDK